MTLDSKELLKNKDLIDDFVDKYFDHYKEWLSEHIGYVGGLDWDSTDTRITYCEESMHEFIDFAENYLEEGNI